MKMLNKFIKFIVVLLLTLLLCNMVNISHHTSATELPQNEPNRKVVDVNISRIREELTGGMLHIPEGVQRKIILYEWIMEAVEQYMAETGIEDVFFCNLENDVLYGDREFILMDYTEWLRDAWDDYVYPIRNETEIDMRQDNYQLMLNGMEYTIYMAVDVKAEKVYIYPKGLGPAIQLNLGNDAAYELIESDDDRRIIYYPDIYVESDWDDLAVADDHFAEVSLDELKELSFLKVPEDATEWLPWCYLNVASVLKRYVEENHIEDVFYFDVDRDVISHVTSMIYTCRLEGNTMTLYMDIDGYNMKAHVYQVED